MASSKPNTPPEKPRRGKALTAIASLVVLGCAGGAAYLGAEAAADLIETRSLADAQAALDEGGFSWVEPSVNGLQLQLGGTAPDEVQRFRALARAAGVVDSGRIVDNMQVQVIDPVATPNFEIELMRNDDTISIIGLVPASVDRRAMIDRLKRKTQATTITDLTETADYAVPEGWDAAFQFGMGAAELAQQSKVSITPGRVELRAVSETQGDKISLDAALLRIKPRDVAFVAQVTAPRPVIAPFALRFVMDDNGARFNACSADTDEARTRILQAGEAAGAQPNAPCTLGLGAPTPNWADAAVPAINAVKLMGAGSVTIANTDVALIAPPSVPAARFDEAVGRLQGALPVMFTLQPRHETEAETVAGPAEFSAVTEGHGVTLRGRITDDRMRAAVESIARARFGQVDSALRSDDTVPAGWTVKAIAALEAMADLERGEVTVTPDLIRITGVSGTQTASDKAAAQLAQRLGAGANYEMAISYDRRLDPVLGLPNGIECVDSLNTIMKESEIGFEPAKGVIAGDPAPTMQRLSEAMTECADFRIELGGHTDSQGSEAFNEQLSQRRAQAVLDAMKEHGIPTGNMTAHGYGESQPVSDNDTDAGREANRRIEFMLLADAPVVSADAAPAPVVTGVTADEATEAAAAAAAAQAAQQQTEEVASADAEATALPDGTTPEAVAPAPELLAEPQPADMATMLVRDLLSLPLTQIAAATYTALETVNPPDDAAELPTEDRAGNHTENQILSDSDLRIYASVAARIVKPKVINFGAAPDPVLAASGLALQVVSGDWLSETVGEDAETGSAFTGFISIDMPALPASLLAPDSAASQNNPRNQQPRPAQRPEQ